ncbi:MAG: TonB C-terminal domain-containing protein, partial [Candidatus Gastranaerophilales bacterium]|nr:TonB C-terminal domain-containing protein [Candidatus Gastranaerophilales bacterium]
IDALKSIRPQEQEFSSNIVNATKELILAYIDNDLSDEGKRFFLKNIIQNQEVRKNYKLFYSLNCEFVSVANSSSIQKIDPEEEENKIRIQSRSDYLIDKAISKYEDENPQAEENIVNEELENDLIANFNEEDNISNNIVSKENILEFSLDELTAEQEPEITEEEYIEPEAEQFEQIQDIEEDNVAISEEEQIDEVIDEHDTVENDTFEFDSLEADNQEFSLDGDEEVFDLAQDESDDSLSLNTHEEETTEVSETAEMVDNNIEADNSIDEDNNLSNNDIELEAEAMEILNSSTEDDLSDIAVDDDELTRILSSDDNNLQIEYESTNVNDVTQNIQESTSEITEVNSPELEEVNVAESASEEDDLFEFLSEIAEQGENNAQVAQEPVASEFNQSEEQNISPDAYNQAVETTFDANNNISQNANDNVELETNINVQQYANQAKTKKSSSNKLVFAMLAVVIVGLGLYTNKDNIISKIHGGNAAEDIQGLAVDNNEALPPPVSDNSDIAKIETNDTATNEAAAPAPTAVADNKTGDNAIPSAQDAPTLPNLPSTTVEPPKAKHMNDAIATALTKDFNGVRISKVSWEASETLVNNPDVKRYLTIAGKSIKNTLSQDLMAATEPSFKDNVVVGITYRKDGSVSKINIDGSSGSAQIDDIVKKSVDNTLKYVKMPALNLSTPEYTTKLIIRL